MKALRFLVLALFGCACAGLALAQNAGQNTAGPTRNDYRLHVVQPAEGATITGDALEVIVDTEIPAERDSRQDVNSMPRPDVDVFVDGLFRETMRDERNVVNVESLQPGSHTIVLLALNRSREIIDRKEIHISMVAPPAPKARIVEHRVKAAPPPAPAPAYVPPPAPPAPVAEPLPKTGTSDPLLAAAGLALLIGGLAIRRFA